MAIQAGTLVKKLNPTCLDALQAAAGLCLSRTNYSVEIEHWLLKLSESVDSDLQRIFRNFDLDVTQLQGDLVTAIDRFKTGNSRTPTLAPQIEDVLKEAWLLASVQYGLGQIRSGVVLLALLSNDSLRRLAREMSSTLTELSTERLESELLDAAAGSVEDVGPAAASSASSPGARGETGMPAGGGAGRALDQYTIDLTGRVEAGEIDPVIGRDEEIRQMVDILIRRRQNNPILTGEAGVGKTAVVEGFAQRVVAGDVPEVLRNIRIHVLDLGLLQAGAGVRGEFENRLKQVISEVKGSPVPIVLFIDEAHTIIGAGGQAGQGDAANLLKPALARGELRTIAATTWAEYKKYFEKDAALARRFQVVKVEEPDEPRAVTMMRGISEMLERHHRVRILDEAIHASVTLSARYLSGRQLPDKSVSLLDTACARVAIGQASTPAAVEDARRRIEALNIELGILRRDEAAGSPHAEAIAARLAERVEAESRLAELEARWAVERERVAEIRELLESIEHSRLAAEAQQNGEPRPDPGHPQHDFDVLRAELSAKTSDLRTLQGESPLMQVCVDSETIAQVIAGWTGIPAGRMMADEIQTVLDLHEMLGRRVVGQAHALEAISQRIRTARANLTDPRRPIGVFLLVGPSGVGKTETALALAEALYGGERNLISINMSEYQEAHTVSGLKGSPPGYVGYGEGGVLTEAVRRRPYSVLLLDEVEKAHPDVMELFFQVFDKGVLEDAEGREIDFKNTVILLTSNVGTDTIMQIAPAGHANPSPEVLNESLRPDLLRAFPAAFLGRLIVVPYYPVRDDVLRQITRMQLDRVARRMTENHGAILNYDDALVETIVARCTEVESGARNVDHILTRSLLPELSRALLARMVDGDVIREARVSVDDSGAFTYEIE
ncbi:type VI secretion system ATPase TssH [Tautonia marina]|uniref:type VI secretion system ATPase TssH n=1 Tax=Tautonia marina TaxID=2653855 RepID=UPI001260BB1D|nr:type VI secretion system ATPase TssH [Tautonia marina]